MHGTSFQAGAEGNVYTWVETQDLRARVSQISSFITVCLAALALSPVSLTRYVLA